MRPCPSAVVPPVPTASAPGASAWAAFCCLDGADPRLPVCASQAAPVWPLSSFVNAGKTRKIGKGCVQHKLVDSSSNQNWSRSLKTGKELG